MGIKHLDERGSFAVDAPLLPGERVMWKWTAVSFWRRVWAAVTNEPHRMTLTHDGTLRMEWAGGALEHRPATTVQIAGGLDPDLEIVVRRRLSGEA